ARLPRPSLSGGDDSGGNDAGGGALKARSGAGGYGASGSGLKKPQAGTPVLRGGAFPGVQAPCETAGAGRGDTGRLALSSVGRESSRGIEPRCGSRPPCVLANHPVSPLPESRFPAGARRFEFRGSGSAILPRPAGQLGPRRQWLATALASGLMLAACGGGGSNRGSGNSSVNNTLPVQVNLGVNNDYANGLFTSVTVCVPGTTNCQTINDVLVDTGSYGLRLLASQVSLQLPASQDGSGNPLGECVQFASSFNWGPVVTADVQLAGEKAQSVPMQLLGQASFAAPPTACASGGVPENDSQQTLEANGVLGIGVFRYDCGPSCEPGSS